MSLRIFVAVLVLLTAIPLELRAQDVPGIEICTVEKAMDRRTSCLQSNIDKLTPSCKDAVVKAAKSAFNL